MRLSPSALVAASALLVLVSLAVLVTLARQAQPARSGALPVLVTIWALLAGWTTVRVLLWRRSAARLEEGVAGGTESVTIVLPVRNEALNVADCWASLQRQARAQRIVIVDDASEDETREIVERLAKGDARISIVDAGPLPAGWRGKTHAVSRGVETVSSEWILMTDADTRHDPDLLGRALRTVEKRSLDALSVAGRQVVRGFGENMITPAIFLLLDALLGDWSRASAGDSPVANGQFVLVRSEALKAIGGLASIRSEVLDDVALAARLKEHGFRVGFFQAPELLSARMYRGFRAAFDGWRRILGSYLGARTRLVFSLATLLALPVTIMIGAIVTRSWPALAVCWAAGAAGSAVSRRGSRHRPVYGLFFPIDGTIALLCLLAGWRDFRRGELAAWKGRRLVLEDAG